MMAGILALDTGMTMGWAYMPAPIKFTHGIWKLPGGQKEPGHAFNHLFKTLDDFARENRPKLIVKEAAILPTDHKSTHGKYAMSAKQRVLMYGLHAMVELICVQRGIKLTEIEPRTLKKQFTGNGNAKKEDMIFRCKTIGQSVQDHNEADAIALLCISARKRVPLWPF